MKRYRALIKRLEEELEKKRPVVFRLVVMDEEPAKGSEVQGSMKSNGDKNGDGSVSVIKTSDTERLAT
jgi:hypothetical protein